MPGSSQPEEIAYRKQSLRNSIGAARRAKTPDDLARDRAAIAAAILRFCAALAPRSRIAAYEPLPTEPLPAAVLGELTDAGFEVLVPITEADRDLNWRRWTTAAQPGAQPLGRNWVQTCSLVLVPALAVDRAGRRLGRGGGSYDRALGRVTAATITTAVLFDGEYLDDVPVDAWDLPVAAIVTPSGWRTVPSRRRRQPAPRHG